MSEVLKEENFYFQELIEYQAALKQQGVNADISDQ